MLGGDGTGATVCLDLGGPWIRALCILASWEVGPLRRDPANAVGVLEARACLTKAAW
jgi:hypothetical protein